MGDAGFDPRGHARSDRATRPAHLIGYSIDRTYKGLICGITLDSAHINLMFARGTELPDPDHLLVGTGKRARHVKIQQSAEIENPAVRAAGWRLRRQQEALR